VTRGLAAVALLAAAACSVVPLVSTEKATALVGGRVQASPDARPIENGVVLIRNTRIAAVGSRADVPVPAGATVIDCAGATVLAGFWNAHVHFTPPAFRSAANAPAEQLTDAMRRMLTSYGFTHVLDTGSWTDNTKALQQRVAGGEIPGPVIMRAGGGLVPVGGSPFYIAPAQLPEAKTVAFAKAAVDSVLDGGADGVKLFTGSLATPRSIIVMPVDVIRAATDAAHARGKFVIAHPSNSAGARAAMEGGVDILAHMFPSGADGASWDRELPRLLRERNMAVIPTLKLWPSEAKKAGRPPETWRVSLGIAQAQLRAFSDLGGQVLVGTDVGYMTDYDMTEEYVFMQEAGLSYARILAALTTAPAERFRAGDRTGRLVSGLSADIVVVDGDPARDIRALAKVRHTIRAGRVLFP
jgi:imidazolonepropionase-like amidohydrolase